MWHKDFQVEQLLDSMHMKWEYKAGLPINKLLIEESKRNNARFGKALDESSYELYSYQMQHNVSFPAIVTQPNGYILGGNNRVHAAVLAGRKVVDSYVVTDATPQQIQEFVRRDNVRHGKKLSEDEMITTCVEIYRREKTPIKELNEKFFGGGQRTYDKILVANHARDVAEKLQEQRVNIAEIPTGTLAALYSINDNKNVLREVGQLISEYALSYTETTDLMKEIKTKSTEGDRIAIISAHRQALLQKTKTGKNPPDATFRREINRIQKFLTTGFDDGKTYPCLSQFITDKKIRKETKDQITDIINLLKRLKENS